MLTKLGPHEQRRFMHRAIRIVFAILTLSCFTFLGNAALANSETLGFIVTVTGSIKNTNRPPFNPFWDAFFDYHNIYFDRAFAFSLQDLRKLGMKEITLSYPNWPKSAITFRGPPLNALLRAAGAAGERVTVRALDGYAADFAMDVVERERFIVAIEMDGESLAIGGRGPAWLVFPIGSYPDQPADSDAGLVWAVFHIEVE